MDVPEGTWKSENKVSDGHMLKYRDNMDYAQVACVDPPAVNASSSTTCKCCRMHKYVAYAALLISIICLLRGSDFNTSCQQILSSEDRLLLQNLRLQKDSLTPADSSHEIVWELEKGDDKDAVDALAAKRIFKREAGKEPIHKKKNQSKKNRKGKKGRCKRKCPRGKRGPQGPEGPVGPVGPPGRSIISGKAAHYTPMFWKDIKETDFGFDGVCIYVEKWVGRACRNRTLAMKSGNMKFFHVAEWVETNENNKNPVKYENDTGEFEVVDDGVYLLYTSVLYYDSKVKQSQAITVNGNKLFKCMDGVNPTIHNGKKIISSKYRTCSITGVTFLKAGDKLAVENLYSNTVLDLTEDATFFGIVQLIPGSKHKHRHRHEEK